MNFSDLEAKELIRIALQSGAIRLTQGVNKITSEEAAKADAAYLLMLLSKLTQANSA